MTLLLASLPATAGLAAESPPLEELFLGQAVFTQEPFELQATMGGQWIRTASEHRLILTPLLELGLTDRLQLEVELPWQVAFAAADTTESAARGQGGLMVGLFDPGATGLGLSVGVEVGFPFSSGGEEESEAEAFIVGYRQVGPVHLNLTGSFETSLPANGSEAWEWGFATTLSVFLRLGSLLPVLELGWSLGETVSYVVAPGLVWPSPLGLEVGVSTPVEVHEGQLAYGALLLATVEFELGE